MFISCNLFVPSYKPPLFGKFLYNFGKSLKLATKVKAAVHPRRCAKCGKSTVNKNLKMYRFPRPSNKNYNHRCVSWARFVAPNSEWSSKTLHQKFYSSHKMLCEEHFSKKSFTDYALRKLYRHAVPCEDSGPSAPQASVSHAETIPMNSRVGVYIVGAGPVQEPCASTTES